MIRRLIITGILTGVAIIFFCFRQPIPDPEWKGKKISVWSLDLLSSSTETEMRARGALVQAGEPAVPHLAKLLERPPIEIPPAFAEFAEKIPFFRDQPKVADGRPRAIDVLSDLGPAAAPALPQIIALLDDPRDFVVQNTESLLRKIGPASAVALQKALHNSSKTIRSRAARILADFPSPHTIQSLTQSLNDDFYEVRANAATSLGRLRAKNSVDQLLATLNDMNHHVRARACEALGSIGDKSANVKLLLLRRDVFPEVQLEAAKALWKINHDPTPILPTLAHLLNTEQSWQAAYTLAEMRSAGAPAVPALIKAMRREQVPRPFRAVSSATFALGQIGAPAIPALIEALADENKIHRANAALALAFMEKNAAPAEAALLQIINDRDENVRQAAALTLGRIGSTDPRAIHGLSLCLRAEDIFLRDQALRLLRELAPDREWAVSLSN